MCVVEKLYFTDREIRLMKNCLKYLYPKLDRGSRGFIDFVIEIEGHFNNFIENRYSRHKAFKAALLIAANGDETKAHKALMAGSSNSLIDRLTIWVNEWYLLQRIYITQPS